MIIERDSLDDTLKQKERNIKDIERKRDDNDRILNRQIEDEKEDLENFKRTMKERKETIMELIKSIDDSLQRFNTMNKQGTKQEKE